jgi:DNA invertase Pin-like site-specific DNA recombinase
MIYGYARCSTQEQNTALQVQALDAAGCHKLFTEHASGGERRRPQLDKLLDAVSRGDTLVVWKLDRLARSVSHLIEIVQVLDERGVNFVSLTEAMNTATPGGRLVFHLFAALAEFERALIKERVSAGVRAAIARTGTWGRVRQLTDADIAKAAAGLTTREAGKKLGVSHTTVHRALVRQAAA